MPDGCPVFAVEAGEVVSVRPFTGLKAGLPHWMDTEAVFVEGASGVVVYGEIIPAVQHGAMVRAGDLIGHVTTVLRKDKGRPMAMLHLEMHQPDSRRSPEWLIHNEKPEVLRDPTLYLLHCKDRC